MAAAVALALALGASPASGLTPQGRRCDELWHQASAGTRARDPQALAQLPEKWKAQAEACRGTSVYQARLAMAYALAGDLESASRTVQGARGAPGDAYLLDYARLVIDYVRVLFPEPAPPRSSVERLEKAFRGFVKAHPSLREAWALLGTLQTILGKREEAIRSCLRGLDPATDTTGAYRNLTIDYSALGRHEEALGALEKAIDRDRSLLLDEDFVYAGARSFAAGGQCHTALGMMDLLRERNPAAAAGPEYAEVAAALARQCPPAKGDGQAP